MLGSSGDSSLLERNTPISINRGSTLQYSWQLLGLPITRYSGGPNMTQRAGAVARRSEAHPQHNEPTKSFYTFYFPPHGSPSHSALLDFPTEAQFWKSEVSFKTRRGQDTAPCAAVAAPRSQGRACPWHLHVAEGTCWPEMPACFE